MAGARHPWGSLGLDLVTLRVFAATADEGSLAKAAEREVIALSAISRRISQLEARSGVQLFDRRDRGMSLTPAGEVLMERLRHVFSALDQVALDLDAMRKGTKGIIRLHTHMSAISDGLAGEIAAFLAEHPGLDVQIEEHTSADVVHAVNTSNADIGLYSGTVDTEGLESLHWREDKLVVIIPKNDPLADGRPVHFADIVDRPFIAMQRDSSLVGLCRHEARLLGHSLQERAYATGFDSVRKMVSAGLGVSIVPASNIIDSYIEDSPLTARPLNETWARRPLMLCARSFKFLPTATKLLVDWLTKRDNVECATRVSFPRPMTAANSDNVRPLAAVGA